MTNSTPSNQFFFETLKPWFPVFTEITQAGFDRHLQAIPVLGLPRKTERANDIHRAIRDVVRPICTGDLLELREEPEGQGLDYIVFRAWIDTPFAIRWGRYNGGTVHRNGTQRSQTVQQQGLLFGGFDVEKEGLAVVTLAHTIEDDFTLAGAPAWWMGKLLLIRERVDESEIITEIASFDRPAQRRQPEEQDDSLARMIRAREDDVARWERMVDRIRENAA